MDLQALKDPITSLIGQINLSYWVLQAVAMTLTCALVPKLKLTSIFGPVLMVVSLSFVNATIWDAALFFQVPNTFTTQALFLVGASGVIFWVLVKLLPGIEVQGVFAALIAPLIFTGCSLLISQVDGRVNWHKIATEALEAIGDAKKHFEQPNNEPHPAH